MKTAKNLIAVLLATVFILSLGASRSSAQEQKIPTKKELATLLKTAKEPPEHLRIAAYYKREAARLREAAKEHSQLATIYEQNHPFAAMELKQGNTFGQGASHCKKFAQFALDEAKEADALAELHERMATTAEQKQQ
jgi:hypothetical protein